MNGGCALFCTAHSNIPTGCGPEGVNRIFIDRKRIFPERRALQGGVGAHRALPSRLPKFARVGARFLEYLEAGHTGDSSSGSFFAQDLTGAVLRSVLSLVSVLILGHLLPEPA